MSQRNGVCDRCGAAEIYIIPVSEHNDIRLYACSVCGYAETYVEPPAAVATLGIRMRPDTAVTIPTTNLPPLVLDGIPIVRYGPLDQRVNPTGRSHLVYADGREVVPERVAIGMSSYNAMVYRFYCDKHWNVLSRATFPTIDYAERALEMDYAGASALLSHLQHP